MGQRGPKPLPGNVHMLRGNPSKKPLAALLDEVVRPPVEIPKCPSSLSADAKAEWRRITRHLEKLGLVTAIDRAALVGYCAAWGDFVWAERRIAELGSGDPTGEKGRIGETPSGLLRPSVVMQIRYRAMELMAKFLAEFGMSPASRSRVTTSDAQMALPGLEKPQEGGWADFK